MKAFETGLHKLVSSLDRKRIFNMMYDLTKSGQLPASRVLKIILNCIEHETAVDVLVDTFEVVLPALMNKFMHNGGDNYRPKIFDLTIKIMMSGRFNNYASAMETLISSAIEFGGPYDTKHWFKSNKIT